MFDLPGCPGLVEMENFPPPEDDLSFVSFKDVAWLQTFGLDATNVLDYFSLSQFFDRSCNNQVLRMQLQFSAVGSAAVDNETFKARLKQMQGLEYEVTKSVPPRLFVIRKQQRYSVNDVRVLASYYVLDGAVYQAPTLKTLLTHRIISSLYYLDSAIEYAEEWLKFDPTKSRYSIKNVVKEGEEEKKNSLDGVHNDKIDFITQLNMQFMNTMG